MSSYYNSTYGETYIPGQGTAYYNSTYGETKMPDGSTVYYNSTYGESRSSSYYSASYYNSVYGETKTPDGKTKYTNSTYGETSSTDCYISSACVYAKDLPDDCYELTILRKYRDQLVAEDPAIRSVVEEYYQNAPGLIHLIEDQPNRMEIYEYIYNELVMKSVQHLINGDIAAAINQYKTVYMELKDKYGA